MAKGAAWTVAARLAIRSIGIVSTIILARLLVPADFGLVAMAYMIYGFIEIMGEFSFDVALIQKQDAGRDYYDTAWTLSILRGLITAAVMFASAGAAAIWLAEPRLVEIIYVFCFTAVAAGFVNIGIVDLRKDMTFGKDFRFMVGVKLCMFVVTIAAAFALRTYWALVIGIVSGSVARLVLGYIMHPYRPRLSLARWREIMHFSRWLLLNNILIFANQRSDGLIVGKILGAATLGLYTIAYEIATLATTELVMPIRRALFPGYAKLAHDPVALRKSFVNGFALIIMLGAPSAVGIGLVADPMVRFLLGDKWLEAIPLLQVLAIIGLIKILFANSDPLFLALGRPYFNTIIIGCNVGVGIPMFILATVQWGVYGIIWALAISNFLAAVLSFILSTRVLRLSVWNLLSAVWRTPLSVGAMTAARKLDMARAHAMSALVSRCSYWRLFSGAFTALYGLSRYPIFSPLSYRSSFPQECSGFPYGISCRRFGVLLCRLGLWLRQWIL